MPKEGEIFINSKGRRLIRSLQYGEDQTTVHHPFDYDYGGSSNFDVEDARMDDEDSYYVGVGDSEDFPRLSSRMLVKFLKGIRDEGPFEYSGGYSDQNKEIEDWLIQNKYVTFVPFNRSLDVKKDYTIDLR